MSQTDTSLETVIDLQQIDARLDDLSLAEIEARYGPMPEAGYDIYVERIDPSAPWYVRLGRALLSIAGEAVAVVTGIAIVWFGAMALLVERGGADLTTLVPNAEMWFAEAFEGKSADIGSLRLVVRPEDGELTVLARDVSVAGDEGEQLNELSYLRADLSLDEALTGKAELRRLTSTGGAITVRRVASGWQAGLGTPENLGKLGPILDLGGEQAQAQLDRVDATGLTLHIVDNVDGLAVRVEEAKLLFEGVERSSLSGQLASQTTRVPFSVRRDGSQVALNIDGAKVSDFASESGRLASLSNYEVPVSADATAILKPDSTFKSVSGSVRVGAGTIRFGTRNIPLNALNATGSYESSGALELESLAISSRPLIAKGEVKFTRTAERIAGNFRVDEISLDTVKLYGERLVIARPSGAFDWAIPQRRLAITDADLTVMDVRFQGDIGAQMGANGLSGLTLDLVGDGVLSPDTLLKLWPEEFVGGARRWIARAVLDGAISNITLKADLPPVAFEPGQVMINGELNRRPLPDDALTLGFDVNNGQVRYISTMTPLLNASGRGILRGNSLDFDLNAATVNGMSIANSTVKMPLLVPKGGPMTITVNGRGSAPDMLHLIDEEPFRFASLYNLNPDEFAGEGEISLTITRPIREFIERSDVTYSVEGAFRNANVPFSIFGTPLTDGDIRLRADTTKLELEGPVSFGPWRAEMTYDDVLGDNGVMPTQATLKGIVSRDALDTFGIGLRQYFDGDIPVEIDATSNGLQLLDAKVRADLTDTNLSLDPYWAKPRGIASDMTMDINRQGEVTYADNIVLTAPGMSLDGALALRLNGALEQLRMERLFIRDVMDIDMLVVPNADRSRLDVTVGGPQLDLSPAVAQRLQNPMVSGGGLPIDLQGRFGELKLAENYTLSDAEVMFKSDGTGIERARLAGNINDSPAAAAIIPSATGRELSLALPDASGAAQALFGWRGIEGGVFKLDATLPPIGQPGAVIGEVQIEDIEMTRAPILAQLLSLASLQGLGDTLSGQGLNFKDVESEFSYRDGVISLRKTRASGPALGITVEGEVGLGQRVLDLNGVLVPAYTANTLLGDIPLIGDILVGKKGEGIVSLSWVAQGPYDAAQITVNPLSALTPGFTREIFKPQREDLPETPTEPEVEEPIEIEEVPIP